MDDRELTIQNGQPETVTPSGRRRGAFSDGYGVNFSIASKNATKVELCLFDDAGERELQRIALPGHTGNVFHGYIPGLKPGQVYGYRVYGPYDPARGLLFNPAKLSFDPSAQETAGEFIYNDAHLSALPNNPNKPDPRDNAPFMVKARVPEPWPDDNAGPDDKPSFPRSDDIIYETNIRGLTMQFPGLPPGVTPGTAAALTSQPVIDRLKKQGNTIELMPVNAGLTERRLINLGLTNLWNYNALGFFAPDRRLFPGGAKEARNTVKQLHKAGFKVVLDLAFNHTAEIDDTGSRGYSLSMRGVDNSTYYRLMPDDKSKYVDWTGCGSTINIDDPETQRLLLDSLRY
jgi:isoamylase